MKDSYGMVVCEYHDYYDIMVADLNISSILISRVDSQHDSFIIPAGHTIKISLISSNYASILVANVIPQTIEFKDSFKTEILTNDVFLYKINNDFEDSEKRLFYADSEVVQTGIFVYNATDMTFMFKDYTSVRLSEMDYYMLVVADYHVGEIEIGFTYGSAYTPHDHYYESTSWPLIVTILGLAGLLGFFKKRKR